MAHLTNGALILAIIVCVTKVHNLFKAMMLSVTNVKAIESGNILFKKIGIYGYF